MKFKFFRSQDIKRAPCIVIIYFACLTSVSMMFGSAINHLLFNPDIALIKRPPGVLPNLDYRTGVAKLWSSVDRSTIKCHAPIYDDI